MIVPDAEEVCQHNLYIWYSAHTQGGSTQIKLCPVKEDIVYNRIPLFAVGLEHLGGGGGGGGMGNFQKQYKKLVHMKQAQPYLTKSKTHDFSLFFEIIIKFNWIVVTDYNVGYMLFKLYGIFIWIGSLLGGGGFRSHTKKVGDHCRSRATGELATISK